MTFQSTEKCPHASCQGSSWFNLTSVIGSGQGCFRGECHHTEWEVCHSLGVHHPSWHYLEVHCQLTDVSQSLGPLWSLSAPQSLWGAQVHPFPQQAAEAETLPQLMVPQAIFQRGECPHIQAAGFIPPSKLYESSWLVTVMFPWSVMWLVSKASRGDLLLQHVREIYH